MANTYSGDPSTSPEDAVRFYISDKKEPWLFSDEEIEFQLEQSGNPFSAAAELAVTQGASYTDRKDKTVGPLSVKYGQVADNWYALAERLRARAGKMSGARAILTQKSTGPYFRLGGMDNGIGSTYGFEPTDPRALLGDEPLPEYTVDGNTTDSEVYDGGTL